MSVDMSRRQMHFSLPGSSDYRHVVQCPHVTEHCSSGYRPVHTEGLNLPILDHVNILCYLCSGCVLHLAHKAGDLLQSTLWNRWNCCRCVAGHSCNSNLPIIGMAQVPKATSFDISPQLS